jgi:hypothetical protein
VHRHVTRNGWHLCTKILRKRKRVLYSIQIPPKHKIHFVCENLIFAQEEQSSLNNGCRSQLLLIISKTQFQHLLAWVGYEKKKERERGWPGCSVKIFDLKDNFPDFKEKRESLVRVLQLKWVDFNPKSF